MTGLKLKALDRLDMIKIDSYDFPFHFQIIFNFMFVTFISPFWVSLGDNQEVELKEYLPQKVVCFLIHCLTWLGIFPAVRGSLKGEKLQNNPGLIFRVFSVAVWASFIIPLTELLWLKKPCIRKFFQDIPRTKCSSTQMMKWTTVLVTIIMAQILVEALLFAWNPETQEYSSSSYVEKASDFANDYLYGSFIISLSEMKTPLSAQATGVKILAVLTHIFQKYQTAISSISFVLMLIAAHAAQGIASSALNIHKDCSADVSTSLNVHFKAKLFIGLIDDLTRNCFVISIMSSMTYVAQYLASSLDEPFVALILLMCMTSCLLGATMYFSAEANLKMKDSEKKLMQLYWNQKPENERMCCLYPARIIKHALGTNGLSFGRFFKITYSFTAQCFSIVLTYTILKIQFDAAIGKSVAGNQILR